MTNFVTSQPALTGRRVPERAACREAPLIRPFKVIKDHGQRPTAYPGQVLRMEWSRSRKTCEGSCGKKTRWVAVYGWKKWRVCARCMRPEERALVAAGYAA